MRRVLVGLSSVRAFCIGAPWSFCLLEISRLAPTPKRAFLWGLSLGVVSEVLLMHWLVYTVSVYGQFGWWLSAMIVIPLYAYLGAFFGLFSLFAHLYALRFKKLLLPFGSQAYGLCSNSSDRGSLEVFPGSC